MPKFANWSHVPDRPFVKSAFTIILLFCFILPGQPRALAAGNEAALQLQPGFEANVLASTAPISNPATLEWDPSGRLWLLCGPSEGNLGSLRIFTLSKGSGKLELQQTFCDGLKAVNSFVFYRDGVILTEGS